MFKSGFFKIQLTKLFCQAAVAIKISNFFFCFSNFGLCCPILEKENFILNLYIVLSTHIKW